MLHRLAGLAALLFLAGFLWFAFRQGLRVKPDPNNRDNWIGYGGGDGIDGGGHGSVGDGSSS